MEMHYKGTGFTNYNGKKYRCHLYLNDDEGGILYRIIIDDSLANYFEFPFDIEYLYGELDNGFYFVLYKAKRTKTASYPGSNIDIVEFQSKYIFNGIVDKGKNPKFNRVSYTISNIIQWGEITTYKIDKYFRLSKKHLYNVETEVLYSNDEYCINYVVLGDMMPSSNFELFKETILLKQQGSIEIISKNMEQEITFFDNLFQKVSQLIELSTLRKVNIEKIVAYSSDYTYNKDSKSIQKEISITGFNVKLYKNNVDSYKIHIHWITLSELLENNSFKLFIENNDKFQPIIELYLETVDSFHSARRTFLNIVQALETYHSRFITNNINEYKKRVERLSTNQQGVNESIINFLVSCKGKEIILRDRIADLLYAEGKIYFETGNINWVDFPKVISDTRNYYIHYDETRKKRNKILDDEELKLYCRVLFKILDYYVLKELGFNVNSNEVKGKLICRWGNVSNELSVLNATKKETS